MKIKQLSSQTVKLISNFPWKKFFFAALTLVSGFSLIDQGLKTYSLVCTRTGKISNTCEIYNFSLSAREVKQFPLNQLKEARLEKSKSRKSRIVTVVLITEKEVIKFGSISSANAGKKQKIVSEVNTFLQNPKQLTISVKEPSILSLTLCGIIFSGASLLIFFGHSDKNK